MQPLNQILKSYSSKPDWPSVRSHPHHQAYLEELEDLCVQSSQGSGGVEAGGILHHDDSLALLQTHVHSWCYNTSNQDS